MKNNFYRFTLLFLVILINFNTKLLANEFNFEAKNIETIDENIIRSPYLKLKDNIMSQSDFSKKQHDILKFYEKFCQSGININEANLLYKHFFCIQYISHLKQEYQQFQLLFFLFLIKILEFPIKVCLE